MYFVKHRDLAMANRIDKSTTVGTTKCVIPGGCKLRIGSAALDGINLNFENEKINGARSNSGSSWTHGTLGLVDNDTASANDAPTLQVYGSFYRCA